MYECLLCVYCVFALEPNSYSLTQNVLQNSEQESKAKQSEVVKQGGAVESSVGLANKQQGQG